MWWRRIGLLAALILGAAIPAIVSSQTFLSTTTPQALSKSDTPTFAGLTLSGGTVTVSTPPLQITQTWNAAQTFVGADMNITDTLSNAGSILQQWRVGGTAKMLVDKAGLVQVTGLALGSSAYGQAASNTIMLGYGGILRAVTSAGGAFYNLIGSGTGAVNSVDIGSASSGIYFFTSLFPSADNSIGMGSSSLNFTGLFLGTSVNSVKVKGGGSGFQIRNGADNADAALTAGAGTFSSTLTANGNISTPSGSKVTTYNGIATTGGGIPSELGWLSLTLQSGSIVTTNLVPAASIVNRAMVRVHIYIVVTQAATTSSSINYTIGWNDGTAAQTQSGTAYTGNTVGGTLIGTVTLNSAPLNAITYATTYNSVGATSMQYSIFLSAEYISST